MNCNQVLSVQVVKKLLDAGVTEFCICPGARNSPLAAVLLELPFVRRYFFYEERSAAFFALGRIKATERPVAVLTTSGTAAGELLPAAMEAHYTGLPLVLVTADRPRRFRWTGAPQTAEQVGIYGVYAEKTLDLADSEAFDLGAWSRRQPLHLNVCFEEPLLGAPSSVAALVDSLCEAASAHPPGREARLASERDTEVTDACARVGDFLASIRQPLVVVGTLAPADRGPVAEFLRQLGAPVYLEAPSGLREDERLKSFRIQVADRLLPRAAGAGYPIDGVLRIGGVPTLRLWRDLEEQGGKIAVCSVSSTPFSGLSWAPLALAEPGRVFARLQAPAPHARAQGLFAADRERAGKLAELLAAEPASEPGIFRRLSLAMPERARVFLGNSLPIREWDLAATAAPRGLSVAASRGLNGIDGQVSTFLGYAERGASNWAVLGDLTALYDLGGPWIISQLASELTLVVVNNSGGKIFERMFPHPEFQNQHAIGFEAWAAMWKLSYERWDSVPEHVAPAPGPRVIEIIPDAESTRRFWKAFDALCLPPPDSK